MTLAEAGESASRTFAAMDGRERAYRDVLVAVLEADFPASRPAASIHTNKS